MSKKRRKAWINIYDDGVMCSHPTEGLAITNSDIAKAGGAKVDGAAVRFVECSDQETVVSKKVLAQLRAAKAKAESKFPHCNRCGNRYERPEELCEFCADER